MMIQGLIDAHVHLQDYPECVDLSSVIADSEQAGVVRFVCNGTSEEDWETVLELSRLYPQVVPCFGLHPWFMDSRSSEWLDILENYLNKVPSGLGEIGLDKCADDYDPDEQAEVFRMQLALARKLGRPAMIHCVRAWGPMMDILRDEPELSAGLLIHAYGGSVELVKPLADMGAYFTFSGTVLNSRFKKAREALQAVPLERLLVETDSPNILPPEEFRRKMIAANGETYNHPANLLDVIQGIAELLGEDRDVVAKAVRENSMRFLKPVYR